MKALRLCASLIVVMIVLLGFASTAVSQTPEASKPAVTAQGSQPHDMWGGLLDFVEKVAWPLTVLWLLFVFRDPLMKVVEQIGRRGGEISFGGLGIKLPNMEQASLGDDVLQFRTTDATTIVNDSAKRTLLRTLREPGTREYAVIDLGDGLQWISSRLFIFAIMLQRMKGIQCIVFLEGSVPKFLGSASPEHVRWSLAKDQPWLEQAYLNAYMLAAATYPPDDSFIVSRYGALDSVTADNLVRNFIQRATAIAPNPVPFTFTPRVWAVLKNSTEYGTWLSGADVQKIMGEELHKDAIVESSDRRAEARALFQCSAPYVARVKTGGEFVSLVNRTAFVNDLSAKLIARLDLLKPPAGKQAE